MIFPNGFVNTLALFVLQYLVLHGIISLVFFDFFYIVAHAEALMNIMASVLLPITPITETEKGNENKRTQKAFQSTTG